MAEIIQNYWKFEIPSATSSGPAMVHDSLSYLELNSSKPLRLLPGQWHKTHDYSYDLKKALRLWNLRYNGGGKKLYVMFEHIKLVNPAFDKKLKPVHNFYYWREISLVIKTPED